MREFAKKFYASALWHKTRVEVLKRDNYICTKCGRPAKEVHHIKPLTPKNIEDYSVSLDMDNLTSLCYDCHRKTHDDLDGKAQAPNSYTFAADGRPARR